MKRTLTIKITVDDDSAGQNDLQIKSKLIPLPDKDEPSFLAAVHEDIMNFLNGGGSNDEVSN